MNLLYQGERLIKLKTSCVKERTSNPLINEVCEILISTMNTDHIQIDILVMSYDRFGHNHVVGTVSMGKQVAHESGQTHWREVMNQSDTACSRWHAIMSTVTTTDP